MRRKQRWAVPTLPGSMGGGCAGESFADGGVVVEIPFNKRVRIRVSQVHLRKPIKSGFVRIGILRFIEGVLVAIVFKVAADGVEDRLGDEANDQHRKHNLRQRINGISPVGLSPSIVMQKVCQYPHVQRGHDAANADQLPQMMPHVMPQLVRKDDVDLFRRKSIQQCIRQIHAPRLAHCR